LRHFLFLCFLTFFCLRIDASCSLDLRDYIAEAQDQSSCAEHFLADLRRGPQSKTLLELALLEDKADRNIVMGLLVLATKGVSYNTTINTAEQEFSDEIDAVNKKTKKTSDAYVLKQFFAAVKGKYAENTKLSVLARKIKFRQPRQQRVTKQVEIDFDKLKAAPCMKNLDATVMRMLAGDKEAVVCAVQFRSALNTPQKKNPIVKAYNTKAEKLEGRVYKVDADLAPHKSSKARDGQVEMSYKGVIQGVIKHVAAQQKFSNLRIARVLQVQGLDVQNLPTWDAEVETSSDFDDASRKRQRDKESLDTDGPSAKKAHIDLTSEQVKEIQRVVSPPNPGQQPQKIWIHPAVVEFLKNLNRQLPKQVVMPHDPKSGALVPYRGKGQEKAHPKPVVVQVNLPKEFMVKHFGKPEPAKEKTAEERGLAIVPYKPEQNVRSLTFTLPAGDIGKFRNALGKVLTKRPLSAREDSFMRGLLKKVIVLPAEPKPLLALPAPKPERKMMNPALQDEIRGFDKATLKKVEIKVTQAQVGKIVDFVKQPNPKKGVAKLDPEVAKFLRTLAFRLPKAPEPAKPQDNKNHLAIVPHTGGQYVQPVMVHVQLPKEVAKKHLMKQEAEKSKTAEEMGLALVPYQGNIKSMTAREPQGVVLSPAILDGLKGAFGKIKMNKPLLPAETREIKGLLRALVVLPPVEARPMLALPAPKPERKVMNPALQKQIKGFDKDSLKKPGVEFEDQDDWFARPGLSNAPSVCKETTVLGILTEMDFGELACAEMAKQQWQSNTGVIGAWKPTLTDRQKSAVGRVIDDHLSRLKNGKKSGKVQPGDENVFNNLLARLNIPQKVQREEGGQYYTEAELDEISKRAKSKKRVAPQNLQGDEEEENAIQELQERTRQVEKDCGMNYQGTLYILRSKLFSQEQRKRCAGLSLSALQNKRKGDFFTQINDLNTSGTVGQKRKLRQFLETLNEMTEGKMPERIIDPLAK